MITKPITVLKSVGPKLVPFFKTVAIFFVLYNEDDDSSSYSTVFYAFIKCLPILCLIGFVLFHGMSLSQVHAYPQRILLGLIASCIGDAFLVWKSQGYFMHGLLAFAIAQFCYILAFGSRPFRPLIGVALGLLTIVGYAYLLPGLVAKDVVLVAVYISLISTMGWRALARVSPTGEEWRWTEMCGFLGAICFIISDFIIAVDRFRYPVPYSHVTIMLSYYAAQLGITLSVVDSEFMGHLRKNC